MSLITNTEETTWPKSIIGIYMDTSIPLLPEIDDYVLSTVALKQIYECVTAALAIWKVGIDGRMKH